MKNQIFILVGFIILTATLAAVSFYGINKFSDSINRFSALRAKEILAEFDFQCAQTYRYTETLKNGVVVSYPMQKEYANCLQTKGKLN